MFGKRVVVSAVRHGCENTPISAEMPGIRAGAPVGLIGRHGTRVPAQVDGDRIVWVCEPMSVGETREYKFSEKFEVTANSGVELTEEGGRIEFRIGGELFTAYHFGEAHARPFLYPIIGPGGSGVTRNYPMIEDVPCETTDHKHHRSMWVAHGEVNGSDNWSEQEGHAVQRHREFLEKTSGPVFGRLRAVNDWLDNQGRKVLEEERAITVYNLPAASRVIDLGVVFRATEGDVTFGDTKEGGVCSIRVATSMDGNKGGLITNSYGGVTEAENWGKRAQWCDYSGPVSGRTVGIAIFDNPANFRHPTYWHVRNYGLMTANPFALAEYKGDPSWDGSHVVKSGDEFAFSYRVYIHDGDVVAGGVGERYHGYINPPVVEAK